MLSLMRRGLVALVWLALVSVLLASPGRARPVTGVTGSILFSSTRATQLEHGDYVVGADGRGLEQVLATHLIFDTAATQWAPDGVRLAYGDLDSELTVVGPTGNVHALHPDDQPFDFAWSPDGRSIAYSIAWSRDGRYAKREQIRIVSASTGRQLPTTAPLGPGDGIRWSPDGNRLAFVDQGIAVVQDVAGSNRMDLTGVGDNQVVESIAGWSPDGKQLVLVCADRARLVHGSPIQGVFVVATDGKHVRKRIFKGGTGASWSPKGNVIAVGSDAGLFLVRPDGTHVRRLLAGRVSAPVWSPDGRALATGLDGDVWVVPLTGGAPRRVTEGWRYGYTNGPLQWNPRGLPASRVPGVAVTDPGLPDDSILGGKTLKTTTAVRHLATDGARVAIAFGGRTCIETWDPLTGMRARFPQIADECIEPSPKWAGALGAAGMSGFALAGERVAWTSYMHFAGRDIFSGQTATISARRPRWIAAAFADDRSGAVVSDLHGSGDLLVFDSWKQSCSYPDYPVPCSTDPKIDDKLFRVDGADATEIASAKGALTPLDVDAGRILVDEQNGTLELLDRAGTVLHTYHYDPADYVGAFVQGADLVVLKHSQLDDYDVGTGSLLREWPLSGGEPRLEDVCNGVAVYVSGQYVHVLRLADGRDVALPSLGTDPHAQIESAGLFYSYTVEDAGHPGRVTFIPFDQLP